MPDNHRLQEHTLAKLDPGELMLQRAYHWEKTRANEIFLTQPMGAGVVRDFTWAQTMDEARRVAAWLKAQGWEPGTRVAIMSKNTAWWFMSDLAIWMAGYVSVPIYPNLVAETVRQIMGHSECKLCIVGKLDDWKAMQPGIPAGLPCITTPLCEGKGKGFTAWDDIIRKTEPMKDSPTFTEDTMATIIYTSGTTGMPKGAVHGFGSFSHTAKALQSVLNSTTEDRALSYLPLAHVAERCLVEGASIYSGSRVYFAESLDTFLADLQRARPTFFFSVPRLWVKFQQGVFAKMPAKKLDRLMRIPILGGIVKKKILKQLGLDSVRFAGTGAAPLPPEVMTWYRNLGLELLEGYGMTEQFAYATSSMPGKSRIGYVGSATACTEVKLSDTGEVLTRGPAHMSCYYKEPEKTRETMTEDGWLRTGDLGEFDNEGRLKIVGRAKEQFKSSKRLSPLDTAWLFTESRATPNHVGGLLRVQAPPDAPRDCMRALMADFRSHRNFTAPWNQRLKLAFNLNPVPAWIEDEDIDLEYHVRHAALPWPGGERELGELVGRLQSTPLDLSRPPWECTIIEGLDGGRFALFIKMHHSLIDGVSGMKMLQRAMSTDAAKSLTLPPFWASGLPARGARARAEKPAPTVANATASAVQA
jgi:long-chain acyl-CoA synthetase